MHRVCVQFLKEQQSFAFTKSFRVNNLERFLEEQ
jgi:hypothetical protein